MAAADMHFLFSGPFWLLGIIHRAKHSLAQQRKPKRIIVIRHAEVRVSLLYSLITRPYGLYLQSKGNRDPTVYGRVPDNQVEHTFSFIVCAQLLCSLVTQVSLP
jgi:hypothetical protein